MPFLIRLELEITDNLIWMPWWFSQYSNKPIARRESKRSSNIYSPRDGECSERLMQTFFVLNAGLRSPSWMDSTFESLNSQQVSVDYWPIKNLGNSITAIDSTSAAANFWQAYNMMSSRAISMCPIPNAFQRND